MEAIQLATLVAEMRASQREYFRLRRGHGAESDARKDAAIWRSIELEKRVDAACAELLKAESPQSLLPF